MRINLSNGVSIEGEVNQIVEVARRLGINANQLPVDTSEYHWSRSKQEWVKISDMATPYLRNAIIKALEEQYENVRRETDPMAIVYGLTDVSEEVSAMMHELEQRSLS